MSKEANLKEKLRQALASTVRVISDDLEIKTKPEDNKSSKKFEVQSDNSIRLKGLTAGMSYHLAGCCSPIKGDTIVGLSLIHI